MADQRGSRFYFALAIGIPGCLFFILSLIRPVCGDSCSPADAVLSALCHQLPSRSLHLPWGISGLCARCTTFWLGLAIGAPLLYFDLLRMRRPPFWTGPILILPLVIDGVLQASTAYTSGNLIRGLTGLLAGLGIAVMALGGVPKRLRGFQPDKHRKE